MYRDSRLKGEIDIISIMISSHCTLVIRRGRIMPCSKFSNPTQSITLTLFFAFLCFPFPFPFHLSRPCYAYSVLFEYRLYGLIKQSHHTTANTTVVKYFGRPSSVHILSIHLARYTSISYRLHNSGSRNLVSGSFVYERTHAILLC